MINDNDKVGSFILLDKVVDLFFVLKLELEHIDNRFLSLSQINIKLLAKHASMHGVI
jgi:hypothetical protein